MDTKEKSSVEKTWRQTHRSDPTPYYGHVSIQYSIVGSVETSPKRLLKRLWGAILQMRWLTLAVQGYLDRLDGLPKLTLGFGERRLEQFEVAERLGQYRGRSFECLLSISRRSLTGAN